MEFTKILMIVLSINLLLFIGGVRVVNSDTTDFLNRFVDTDKYTDEGLVVLSDDLVNAVPTNYDNTQVGDALSFIDTVGVIASFLIFLVNILFTPIGLLMGTGLPAEVGVLIGIPLTVGLILGFIYLLRSGK